MARRITDGHYSLRADEYDALPEDPIEVAQSMAAEARIELNATVGPRSADSIAEVQRLSERAGSAAIDANAALVLERSPETDL